MNTRDPACCGTCAAIVSALTPEQPVKAPGQGGDIFLTRGTPVEAVWPSGNYSLYYDAGPPARPGFRRDAEGRAVSRDFTTKPRPDQPGRCPSIDPHDTLQCTRAIHDDDQCQAGGIAWRKGSPRIESDRERADRLQEDVEEYDAILTRQSDLLTRTVNALRGNPPPLTSWSHHDIPKLAAEKVSEIARLTAERDALAAQVARAESLAGQWDGDDSCDNRTCVPHRSADALRAALAGSEADTSDTQPTDQEDQS